MTKVSNEDELKADAQAALGDGETVLAAGVFSLEALLGGTLAGTIVGGTAGQALGGAAGQLAGVVAGAYAGREAMAAHEGTTVKLILAVTETRLHLLRWGAGDASTREKMTFDRATTTVAVKKMGLSRIVTLDDSATGAHVSLHASVSAISAQSGPDKDVLALLAGH
jgi:hypothetical protein